jgi:Coenzyme PQQ synthesis protein D (PqqD)
MTNERPRIAQGLEFTEVEDGLIVYEESTERVHHLNPTAAIVFQLCDGSRDATEIAWDVADLFGLDDSPTDAVESCIARFVQERLVR